MTRTLSRRNPQAGYSLAEILVAIAIFAVIMVAALMSYDRSNRVFKQSVDSSDIQQNTRVAFNRLVSDVRMTGFDFDRDGIPAGATVDDRVNSRTYSVGAVIDVGGNLYRCSVQGTTAASIPTFNTTVGAETTDGTARWVRIAGANQYQQPDEQVEYAGRTAITVRGNLDYETDSANDHGRETGYEPSGGQFPVVTTANDEIVTYALVSTTASANDDSITFYADIAHPRSAYPGGSAESLVTIDGVDTSLDSNGLPANPPYTLYRVNLNTDGTLNRVPVADNIRSVRYTYYEDQTAETPLKDLSGAAIPTTGVTANTGIIGGLGQYDPASTASVPQREIRKKIRSVRIELVGMSAFPDNDYTNPDETNAAVQHYRTYTLATVVVPRNLGKHGIREQSTSEPGPPSLARVCRAGCGVLHVEWNAPSVTAEFGAVEQYQVEWGQMVSGAINWSGNDDVGNALEATIAGLDPTLTWYIQVKAVNTYGSNTSSYLSIAPVNMTKPLPPANVVASTDQVGAVNVTWDAVSHNVTGVTQNCVTPSGTSSISGDDILNPAETIYRVFRNTLNDGTGATGTVTELWSGLAAVSPYTGSGPLYDAATNKFSFTDNTVANCTSYYYFVEAIDKLCYTNVATNSPANLLQARSGASTGAQGTASSGSHIPSAPEELMVDETSSCSGSNCTIKLNWPRVTTDDAGNTIAVSEYAIRTVTRKESDNSIVSDDAASPTIVTVASVTTTPVTHTFTKSKINASGEALYFEFQVAAQQCANPGPVLRSAWIPNPGRKFPCVWSATNPATVTVAATPYDGDGLTANSAWTVTDPSSLTVSTTTAVSEVKATFRVISPTPSDPTVQTQTNTASASFSFPQTPTNGQTWQVDFELTDSNGCKKFITRYVFDSPTSCCLLPTFYDSNLISGTSRTITVKLANICDLPITIQSSGVTIHWDTAYVNGNKLDTIQWPGVTGTTSVNNMSGTVTLSPPTGATTVVASNTSTYQFTLTFTKNINTSVLTNFCITYRLQGALSNSSCKVVVPSGDTSYTVCN